VAPRAPYLVAGAFAKTGWTVDRVRWIDRADRGYDRDAEAFRVDPKPIASEPVPARQGVPAPPDDLRALHRSMVRLRAYDERSVVYHRQGRIGTYAIFWGHEALQAGAVHALRPEDWIFPSYRESAIGLLRGMPASTVFSWWRGHPDGWSDPRERRIAPISVPVGSHVPHAAGMAWGLSLRGEPSCVLAIFGDGATSTGAFHEGMTFAAARRVPAVFLCNNNSWAISTPTAAQSGAERLADKAVGYGMKGIRVDGADVLAVRGAVAEAAARARAGQGPQFIEAVTFRAAPHATADDPSRYMDPAQVRAARERECLGRFESRLRALGALDERSIGTAHQEALAEMEAGIEAAESLPEPDPRQIFDTTYALPPRALRRSRDTSLEP
jgi:pyruvate dehydrogenase E1 component alpha subunit